ncbi:MAG TPA: serine/threonine protein kinase, partial [Planctomycetes bacterium]|nr:serine/threonine protein kinase [Planctomycetota bacterium]
MSLGRLGPYRLEAELGRGGMGAVYRAFDERAQRHVALKVLLPGADPEEVLRLRREAEALAQLALPGVVRVHSTGLAEGQPYVDMELIQGESLAARLRREGALPSAEAAALTQGLAETLARVHAAGILHRDLKPANVLLHPERGPLLVDFGLARISDRTRLTETGEVMGTPAYMSPEQARGERVDARCDVYGLG